MKTSLKGHSLPESHDDAVLLGKNLKFKRCNTCGGNLTAFSAASTPAGWRETQISGMCEPCFDGLFAETDGAPSEVAP